MMRGNNSAARKAAERQGGSGHVALRDRASRPYVSLAMAVLALAAEDAARDNEDGIRARVWLRQLARGAPGWWDYIPGFRSELFASHVLRVISPCTQPRPAPLVRLVRQEQERQERFEQCILPLLAS
jgi:hypothetical protein